MRRGEQMYAETVPYFQKEEETGGKKKGPAAATPVARQQQRPIACQGQPGKHFIRSDCGSAYLLVSTEVAAKGAANAGSDEGAAQFAATVPYFAGA